ncbi:XRE family transcriptional regulator [Sorangium sp. So ce590]|uniref:ImmA/IrrE family metallo-endopeptidase n=1 Tax=Sorangium sp. So ce590 TaxID=3133317 RepID=UPI003F648086
MSLSRSSGPASGSFNQELLVLAREARGLSQSDLATQVGMSQGHLSKIETGLIVPSPDIIRSVARVLRFPERFFSLTDRVYGPSISEFYHRKRKAAPLKLIHQIHANINLHRMFLERLLRSAETPKIDIPRYDPDEFDGDVEEIARVVRATWQLPKGPIRNLTEAIEDAGGIVYKFQFETPLVDAVSCWVPDLPPMFFLNTGMPADRERMSLAHELGHMVMHQMARPDIEDEANKFAAELLMPAEDIRHQLRDVSLASLAGLKPFWRVSMQALLVRASHLKTINESRYDYLWAELSRRGYKKREPVELDFPNESPSTMREILDAHAEQLGYTLNDLERLFPLDAEEYVSRYNYRPQVAASARLRVVK